MAIGFVDGIDVIDDDVVVIVEVTESSFVEWIEEEVAQGSIQLEL